MKNSRLRNNLFLPVIIVFTLVDLTRQVTTHSEQTQETQPVDLNVLVIKYKYVFISLELL